MSNPTERLVAEIFGEPEDLINYAFDEPMYAVRAIDLQAIVGALLRISEFDRYEPAGPAAETAKNALALLTKAP